MKTLLPAILALCLACGISAQTGPDLSFGYHGKTYTSFGGYFNGTALLLQSDGKLIMTGALCSASSQLPDWLAIRLHPGGVEDAGFANNAILTQYGWAAFTLLPGDRLLVASSWGKVSRFFEDGLPDILFGNNGIVQADAYFDLAPLRVQALLVQPDGKMLLAGGALSSYPEYGEFFIIRLLPDGSPDPGFGENGLVQQFPANLLPVRHLALQADGKILAASSSSEDFKPRAVRLNEDGSFDETFGQNGISVPPGPENTEGRFVTVQPDGKVWLSCSGGSLFRLLPDGQPDSTFHGDGHMLIPNGGSYRGAIGVQEDGKVVAGFSENGNFAIGRWNGDGSADSTFGLNGVQEVNIWGIDQFTALQLLPDGKIAAGGYSDGGISVVQLLPDGSLDPDFASAGIYHKYMGGGYATLAGLGIQSSGKIVAGGTASIGNIAVSRYLGNGSPDPEFGIQGQSIVNLENLEFQANAMALQPDDKIVLAGNLGNDFFLFRMLPDGAPDTMFGQNGIVVVETGNHKTACTELLIQPDGKFLLAGRWNNAFALLRCLPDGQADTGFGEGGWAKIPGLAQANAIALQADGRILASSPPDSEGFNLFRFLPDGTTDLSFNFFGKAITGIEGLEAICVQPDGKILAGGFIEYYSQPLMIRLLPGGALDPGFQFTDLFSYPPDYEYGQIASIAVHPDGTIGFAGEWDTPWDNTKYAIFGLVEPGGGMGPDVNSNYKIALNKNSSGKSLLVQPDGKFLLGGSMQSVDEYGNPSYCPGSRFGLSRFHPGMVVGTSGQPAPAVSEMALAPNPTCSQATLTYTLARDGQVSVSLSDLTGRLVHTLISSQARPAGTCQEVLTLPAELPQGAWLLTVHTGKGQKSIILIK